GGGGLALHPSEVVDPDAGGGDELLGAERLDLARGADERRLADAEAARDEDLDLGRERLRLVVGHRAASPKGLCRWGRPRSAPPGRSSPRGPPGRRGGPW